VASGAVAVVASQPEHLDECEVAFVEAGRAAAAVDVGVEDVLAVSGHPLGARLPGVPALCLDAAVEVPAYGDRFLGPYATAAAVELDGRPYEVPGLEVGPDDRVLTALTPASRKGLGVLLATLRAGGSLVLLAEGDAASVAEAERVTATAGVAVPGVREL
jgi:hypothetical protein